MLENKRPFVLRTIQYLHRAKTVLVSAISLYFCNGRDVGCLLLAGTFNSFMSGKQKWTLKSKAILIALLYRN